MNNPANNSFIGAYVEKDLKDKLRSVAKIKDTSASRIIEDAVKEKVDALLFEEATA